MRIILISTLLILFTSCRSGPSNGTSEFQYRSYLDNTQDIAMRVLPVDGVDLHYAELGNPGQPTIVFIHGTPGSWRSLGRLMNHGELAANARLVSIDRPGWGSSRLPADRAEGSFEEQVRMIEPLVRMLREESPDQPLILVGHSLGASIAPYFAYKYPELVDGLLMAAGAIDPELGKPRWYNHAANIWPISRLISDSLVKANVEIWGVHDALKTLEPWWESVEIPMIYMQGEEDELVHPDNLDFAENFLPDEVTRVVRIPDQGHLLHRERGDMIATHALDLLEASENAGAQIGDD